MNRFFLNEHMPSLTSCLYPDDAQNAEYLPVFAVLEAGYDFSRMMHGSPASSGGSTDAFYRGFVPELAGHLSPRLMELVKRCMKSEKGETCRVGATVFPGMVKVSKGQKMANGEQGEHVQAVMRRAQVVCECALLGSMVTHVQHPPSE